MVLMVMSPRVFTSRLPAPAKGPVLEASTVFKETLPTALMPTLPAMAPPVALVTRFWLAAPTSPAAPMVMFPEKPSGPKPEVSMDCDKVRPPRGLVMTIEPAEPVGELVLIREIVAPPADGRASETLPDGPPRLRVTI